VLVLCLRCQFHSKKKKRSCYNNIVTKDSSAVITPRVLVIDDNKDITEMLKDFFETENIECKIINDGNEGLNEILKEDEYYDFILLDLTMPEFSGLDIFKKLKDKNVLNSKNLIIFTASAKTDKEVNEIMKEGAKYFLRKPFSLNEILKIVEKFIINKK
jgi:DNA-binding response OmpR family regulator